MNGASTPNRLARNRCLERGREGLGPGRLLATSEAIRDAHWAFIER
jgi:hypothetical protein